MKVLLTSLVLLVSLAALAKPPYDEISFEIDGSLTLKGNLVIYDWGKTHDRYDPLKVPSLQAVSAEKGGVGKSGEETAITKIVFKTADSKKLVLTNNEPVKITRKTFKDAKEPPIFLIPDKN